MTFGGVVFLLVLVGLIVAIILTYNKLVGLRQRSEEAWSDIDVQLKRRTDLVPNLIETVKGYAAHERTTLDQVVRARGAAVAAQTQEARAQAENQLAGAPRWPSCWRPRARPRRRREGCFRSTASSPASWSTPTEASSSARTSPSTSAARTRASSGASRCATCATDSSSR